MAAAYLWKTVRASAAGDSYEVHGFAEATSGVLEGQTIKHYLNSYDLVTEAVREHPELMDADGEINYGSKWTDPQVSFSHLSNDGDRDYE